MWPILLRCTMGAFYVVAKNRMSHDSLVITVMCFISICAHRQIIECTDVDRIVYFVEFYIVLLSMFLENYLNVNCSHKIRICMSLGCEY